MTSDGLLPTILTAERELDCQVHYHYLDLQRGVGSHYRGDEITFSASTRKIFILMTALFYLERGNLEWEQMLSLSSIPDHSGILRYLTLPEITLVDAITLMIIVSDNEATTAIVNFIGYDRINDYTQAIGCNQTHHGDGITTTTANDLGYVLSLILDGSSEGPSSELLGCRPDMCQYALDILLHQQFNTRLPLLLPRESAKVAHKTGTSHQDLCLTSSPKCVVADAGIIYDHDHPRYIMVVIVSNLTNPQMIPATMLIARLSQMTWNHQGE